jgi:hypothetical protein
MDELAEDDNNCSNSLYKTVNSIEQEELKDKEQPKTTDKEEKVLKELEDSKII